MRVVDRWFRPWIPAAARRNLAHHLRGEHTLVGLRAATAPFLAGLVIPLIGVRWTFAASCLLILAGAWLLRGLAPRPASPGTAPQV